MPDRIQPAFLLCVPAGSGKLLVGNCILKDDSGSDLLCLYNEREMEDQETDRRKINSPAPVNDFLVDRRFSID